MTGAERRKTIIKLMKESTKPLSGGALGTATGVSRQVVVQDIALLRSEGYSILATARGYLLDSPKEEKNSRLFKVFHDENRTEEELKLIVDLGGCVEDVMVNHKVYGKVSAALNIIAARSDLVDEMTLQAVKSTKKILEIWINMINGRN